MHSKSGRFSTSVNVEYPEMRERLIGLLRDVNDPMADRTWEASGGHFDDWFNDLEFLLPTGDGEAVGAVLADTREAKAVLPFQTLLDAIYADLGDAGYVTYRADPRWSGVRHAARDALAVLDRAEPRDE
jgi:hypothetical protein